MLLTKQKHYRKDNRYGYETGRSPFIDYILEDKESYKPLFSSICRFTGKPWIDRDNDFLIGESGGVLMKIDFIFVGTEIFSRVADFYEKPLRRAFALHKLQLLLAISSSILKFQ